MSTTNRAWSLPVLKAHYQETKNLYYRMAYTPYTDDETLKAISDYRIAIGEYIRLEERLRFTSRT